MGKMAMDAVSARNVESDTQMAILAQQMKQEKDYAAKVWGWKNGVLQFSNATMKTSSAGTAGQFNLYQDGYTLSGALTYVDYLRIYSEDGQLIQSIIE